MADVTLAPTDALLRYRLQTYVETLEERGLDVELERPREERGMTPETAAFMLVITVAGNIISQEWPWMKEKLREWFTQQPRREQRRVLEVSAEDTSGQLFDQFTLKDDA